MIVGRLKEAHNRGDPLDNFCSSAYEWFQGKYGDKCANQCDKLQCKPACEWLKRKKDYDNKANYEDKREDQAKADKAQLRSMKRSLDDLEDATKQNKRTVGRFNVKVRKAFRYLADA